MRKKWLITGSIVILLMGICTPTTIYAKTKNKVDIEAIQRNDFEIIIQQIINIKTGHPEYSEDTILKIMDGENSKSEYQRGIVDIWNMLTPSEKKLCIRYPFDALKVNDAKNIATSQTEKRFGYNGLGDRSDAFRHGIWNAEMVILIGSEKAELFATAHEDKDVTGYESDGYLKTEHQEMDLHNNGVGRTFGESNKSVSENQMADIIYGAVNTENSQFVWLHE